MIFKFSAVCIIGDYFLNYVVAGSLGQLVVVKKWPRRSDERLITDSTCRHAPTLSHTLDNSIKLGRMAPMQLYRLQCIYCRT